MSDELLLYLMMAGRGKRPKWSEPVGSLFFIVMAYQSCLDVIMGSSCIIIYRPAHITYIIERAGRSSRLLLLLCTYLCYETACWAPLLHQQSYACTLLYRGSSITTAHDCNRSANPIQFPPSSRGLSCVCWTRPALQNI